jgi:hypothetical protein
MDVAIITDTTPTGGPLIRSSVAAPGPQLFEEAERLDRTLRDEIRDLEASLVDRGLLAELPNEPAARAGRGGVALWHSLGVGLRDIAERHLLTGLRERRWLWEAIEKRHASPRVLRAGRGRNRNHFEYCFRLSRFPIGLATQLQWSEWVYFFDSRTVREEQRIDEWLVQRLRGPGRITRAQFRRFSEALNARLRTLDTSVLSNSELFRIYDEAFHVATSQIADAGSAGPRDAQDPSG